MTKVLVTGSRGFIGSHTVQHLERECGLSVVAGTRDGSNGSRRVDVRDFSSLTEALSDVSAIVHCAVGDRTVTVDGTRHLLRAAAKAGIRRVVHLSSMSVYGGASGNITEDTPLVSADRNDYPGWKAAAEQACLEAADVETVRLRPTIVYGPRGTYWLGLTARRIRSGRWGVFGTAGEGTCNLVHVSDVARAIAAALSKPEAAGRAFNVNGPETTTWNGYFSALANAMGAPPLPTISAFALHTRMYAALPLKVMARFRPNLGRELLLGVPGRSEIGLYSLHARYLIDTARDVMGWVPSMSIKAGLANSVEWLRTEESAT